MNRRNALKNGLMTLGGMVLAPHISMGAFSQTPVEVDGLNRIIYSPFVREYFLEEPFPQIVAKLNSNENPYGPADSAKKAVMDVVSGGGRYAWKEMSDLITKIVNKEGVTSQNIMMGPGSSDLLEKVGLVLFMNGGNIVSADPTYMSMINVSKSVGADWKAVPCTSDWSHDLEAMEAAIDKNTKLVYICNPNNPTGAITDGKKLLDFCARVSEKVPVFVDEAYLELADGQGTQSMVSLVAEGKNVIVARTFSKVMGMAGLRVGYMVATSDFLKDINKITRGGMGISLTSIAAASATFDDKAFQEKTITSNAAAKEYLYGELSKMGYSYIPSYTNFVLFPIAMNGKEFLTKMTAKGVGVRSFQIKDKTYCRVSIGTLDEMKLFTKTLGEIS